MISMIWVSVSVCLTQAFRLTLAPTLWETLAELGAREVEAFVAVVLSVGAKRSLSHHHKAVLGV